MDGEPRCHGCILLLRNGHHWYHHGINHSFDHAPKKAGACAFLSLAALFPLNAADQFFDDGP